MDSLYTLYDNPPDLALRTNCDDLWARFFIKLRKNGANGRMADITITGADFLRVTEHVAAFARQGEGPGYEAQVLIRPNPYRDGPLCFMAGDVAWASYLELDPIGHNLQRRVSFPAWLMPRLARTIAKERVSEVRITWWGNPSRFNDNVTVVIDGRGVYGTDSEIRTPNHDQLANHPALPPKLAVPIQLTGAVIFDKQALLAQAQNVCAGNVVQNIYLAIAGNIALMKNATSGKQSLGLHVAQTGTPVTMQITRTHFQHILSHMPGRFVEMRYGLKKSKEPTLVSLLALAEPRLEVIDRLAIGQEIAMEPA